MTETFLPIPARTTTRDLWSLWSWLPAAGQIRTALALHVDQVVAPWQAEEAAPTNWTMTSMRQGMGLVVLAAVVGGAIPFVVNWIQAAQMGTAFPLLEWARYAEQQRLLAPLSPYTQAWSEAALTVAGLPPYWPVWAAAGLSALGVWINWPLTWLTIWIVYGVGVLGAIKLQGAPNTLPHFYAATSYAFVPLVLWGLSPVPYLGFLFALAGSIWGLLLYGQAVRTLTAFSTPRVMLSMLAPIVVAAFATATVLGLLTLIFTPLLF